MFQLKALQVVLFAPGPFYCYPWKPLVCALYGDDFAVGLKHFKHGHYGGVNVALHMVALFIQTLGNFAFLGKLDEMLPPQFAYMRVGTAVAWPLFLFALGPPQYALASTVALAVVYHLSPLLTIPLFEQGIAAALITVLVLSNMVSKRKVPLVKSILFAGGVAAWTLAWQWCRSNYFGVFAAQRQNIVYGVIAFLVGISLTKNPLKPLVVISSFALRFLGIVTGSDALFYFSYAFAGSLCQGVTHAITKEEATLIALERQGEEAKVRFEYSHVTYFPSLLLKTAWDVLTA